MNNRTKGWMLLAGFIVFGFLCWLAFGLAEKAGLLSKARFLQNAKVGITNRQNAVATKNAPSSPSGSNLAYNPKEQVEAEKKVWDLLLATPIEFYGKVIDADGNPVPEATAAISMVDTPWDGHTKVQKTSNTEGCFSVSGHGLGIVVDVTKKGYYTTTKSGGSFGYASSAGPTNTHQSAKNPAIFVLIKRGETERLIVTKGNIKITGDGSPREMSLKTGNLSAVTNGDIIVQLWMQNQGIPANSNKPYNWRCKLTVPGGGIQPRANGSFDFTAPENGYQSSDEINMSSSLKEWDQIASRSYFIKLSNGDYCRADFKIIAGGEVFFTIMSYLNPTPGHRNLEFDPEN